MKYGIFSIAFGAALMLSLTSCDDHWSGAEPTDTTGGNSRLLLKDHLLVEVNDNASRASRAVYDLSAFNVKILTQDGTAVDNADWNYSSMPGVFDLAPGDYIVEVISDKSPAIAAWEAPYFKGSKSFSITAGEIKDLGTVTCNLANLKVSVRFTQELINALDDGTANVDVRVNQSDALTFGVSESRSGYYMLNDDSSSMVAEFTGIINGNTETMRQVFTDNIKPGYHRIITFGIKTPEYPDPDPSGTIDPSGDGIQIDVTVTTEDVNGGVSVGEDNINPGDNPGGNGEGGDKPVQPEANIEFTSDNFDLSGWNDPDEYGPDKKEGVLNIHADNGFAHIYVQIDSETLTPEELADANLPAEFDLANPVNSEYPDLAETLDELGFPISDKVTGTNADGSPITDVKFDITQFLPLVPAVGPGKTTFIINVVDKNNNKKTLNLKFEVK